MQLSKRHISWTNRQRKNYEPPPIEVSVDDFAGQMYSTRARNSREEKRSYDPRINHRNSMRLQLKTSNRLQVLPWLVLTRLLKRMLLVGLRSKLSSHFHKMVNSIDLYIDLLLFFFIWIPSTTHSQYNVYSCLIFLWLNERRRTCLNAILFISWMS